jgi:Uma2 family endonuclease
VACGIRFARFVDKHRVARLFNFRSGKHSVKWCGFVAAAVPARHSVHAFSIAEVDMSTDIHKLTYRDYVCFPDDGKRHEIIDGDHYMNPAPSTYHQAVSRRIQFQLYSQIELSERGEVIYAPVDVELSPYDIVQPDLVVVLSGRNIITPTKVKGVPDHLVEILSPSSDRNDRELKFNLYQRVGVPEYWIVDPFEHQVLQFRLADGRYQETVHYESIICDYLDGTISVDLTRVW